MSFGALYVDFFYFAFYTTFSPFARGVVSTYWVECIAVCMAPWRLRLSDFGLSDYQHRTRVSCGTSGFGYCSKFSKRFGGYVTPWNRVQGLMNDNRGIILHRGQNSVGVH